MIARKIEVREFAYLRLISILSSYKNGVRDFGKNVSEYRYFI